MGSKLDLMGQKFGRLEVIAPAHNIKGRTAWLCKCDCGNEKKVITKFLRNGTTKSCGCLHKEVVSKMFSKDLKNQKFGKLTALNPTEERKTEASFGIVLAIVEIHTKFLQNYY